MQTEKLCCHTGFDCSSMLALTPNCQICFKREFKNLVGLSVSWPVHHGLEHVTF